MPQNNRLTIHARQPATTRQFESELDPPAPPHLTFGKIQQENYPMKNIRLTPSEVGRWIYCVESPDQGEHVRISDSEEAEAVHITHWSDKGDWCYIERSKEVYVGKQWRCWMGDGDMDSEYKLLKLDNYRYGDWLLEIRSVYRARYVEGDDNSLSYDCAIHGPTSLRECFKILMDEDMISDLVKVSDQEVAELAWKYFCHHRPQQHEESWLKRMFS